VKTSSLVLVAILGACGGSGADDAPADDAGDDTATPDAANAITGKVTMTFSVTNGVRQSPNLTDTLDGPIYGQIFHSSDVSLTGPMEGAMEYGSVEVASVDLTTAQMAGAYTSPELAPGMYTFLGFFDVDDNGATDRSPDAGDPVTIPITNQFEIDAAGADTTLTVAFDFVYN
jgi:hypothetical protein